MIAILLVLLVHIQADQGNENVKQNFGFGNNLTQIQSIQSVGLTGFNIMKKLEALKGATGKPFDDDKLTRSQEVTTMQGMKLIP